MSSGNFFFNNFAMLSASSADIFKNNIGTTAIGSNN
jgi:hypothetical protein